MEEKTYSLAAAKKRDKKIRTLSTLKDEYLCINCVYQMLKVKGHYCGCFTFEPPKEVTCSECKHFATHDRIYNTYETVQGAKISE